MIKLLLFLFIPIFLKAESFCFFTPPSHWELIDPKALSKRTVIGFIEKRKHSFAPSLNLTSESLSLPASDYLKLCKKNCLAKKMLWRDLGSLSTASGEATLIEIETLEKMGKISLLQAFLFKGDNVYVLTGGVLKKDLIKYAEVFEKAMRSLTVTEDLFTAASSLEEKAHLLDAWKKKETEVESKAFEEVVLKEFSHLGTCWQVLMLRWAQSHSR